MYQPPAIDELGLMLDIGRKRFSPEVLMAWLDEMASLGFNLLHLHFSENIRFGVESHLVPTNSDWEPPLTRSELSEVVDYAGTKGIEVMGEIGMPGHMGAILTRYPHLALANHPDSLDITKPEALTLCKALIEESLPLFNSGQWHLGADEYLPRQAYAQYPELLSFANDKLLDPLDPQQPAVYPQDAKIWFINQLADWLTQGQTKVRVWGDDIRSGPAVLLRPNIVVDWWTDYSPLDISFPTPSPEVLIKAGHSIVNCSWVPCYWVLSDLDMVAPGFPRFTDAQWLSHNGWQANHFQGRGQKMVISEPQAVKHITGAKLQVWCDQPDTMRDCDILAQVRPLMHALALATGRLAHQ